MDDTQRWLKGSTLLQVSYMEELITIRYKKKMHFKQQSRKRKEAEEYAEKVNI